MKAPTPREQVQIAAHAEKSPKTVARAYQGRRVYDTTHASIARAARELGYPEPPAPQQRSEPERAA